MSTIVERLAIIVMIHEIKHDILELIKKCYHVNHKVFYPIYTYTDSKIRREIIRIFLLNSCDTYIV